MRKIRPCIITFFDDYYVKSNYEIILIERKIPINFSNSITQFRGGERRLIFNHEELKNKLNEKYPLKFKNVILEDLDMFEQYNIFRNAKIIIGQHGAGLTNIFFCNPDTKIIEITPYYNSCCSDEYINFSNFFNLNYIKIIQNKPTVKEFISFNNKYKLFTNGKNIFESFENIENEKYRLEYSPFIYFIKSSGSVNVRQILNAIL